MGNFTMQLNQKILDPGKRVRYTTGLVLGVDEFVQEQTYFLEHDRLHHRALHGYGTAYGLRVTTEADEGGQVSVMVTAGLAIDARGRPICVPTAQCARLTDWINHNREAVLGHLTSMPGMLSVYVMVCHCERETDYVPVPGGPCRSQQDSQEATRVTDDFILKLSLAPPVQEEEELVRRFAALLAEIEITDEGGPYLSEEELLDRVRALVETPQVAEASPPEESLPTAPRLHPDEAYAAFQAAYRVWVTEVRSTVAGMGRCGGLAPTGESCVLLARLDMVVADIDGALLIGDQDFDGLPDVDVDEAERPLLLSTRMLQEHLLYPGQGGMLDGGQLPHTLTRIVAMNWQHGGNTLLAFNLDDTPQHGLVLGFGKNVLGDGGGVRVDGLNAFSIQVFMEREVSEGFFEQVRVEPASIVPVRPLIDRSGRIVGAERVEGPLAEGVAFIIESERFPNLIGRHLTVVVKGDFIADETGRRAIYAGHLLGRLSVVNAGTIEPGGRFESWLRVIGNIIDINTATAEEFSGLSGVGPALAQRIVAARDALGGSFTAIEDLLAVNGIGERLLLQIRPFLRIGTAREER